MSTISASTLTTTSLVQTGDTTGTLVFQTGATPATSLTLGANQTIGLSSSILEGATVSATAATGTVNFDVATQAVLYYTTNASANWTLNIRGNSTVTLNSLMAVGQSLCINFLATQGATAYYATSFTIDGVSVTPKWQGGITPTNGNVSGVDIYSYVIVKTAASTYTVFATQTKFA